MANSDMVKFIKELKKVEGNASLSKNIHPKTKSKYGAYYDDVNNLTAGTGDLIYKYDKQKTPEKNKQLEEKAIVNWKKNTGYNPFTLTETQSNNLLRKRINSRIPKIKKNIKIWDSLASDTKTNLLSSWFRGSLSGSKKTLKYLNSGNFKAASKEFLNHGEYRRRKAALDIKRKINPKARDGVVERMEKTSKSIFKLLNNNEESMKKEKQNKSIMGPLQSLQLKNEKPGMSMELMSLEKIPTQQVDEVVNRSPASKQVPEETINKVKDELKVPGEQDRIQNNAKTGQNKQPMDQLKEAFMYFGPQILTSILVGPEAGAKTGELLKGYRQDLLKQQQLAKKEEITPYQRESLDRQDRRIRLERDKMKDIQKRSDKRFGYRQEENIAKQMGKEAAFDRGMHQLNRMEKILSKNPAGFTGKIDAIKQKAAQEIGSEDPNFTAFQQAVTDFGSQYIKEISGAQVSDAERKRLDEALPSVWAQESVNMSRIKGIKNLMLAIKDRNDRIKARLGGAIPKGMKLKDFFKPGDELDVDGILKGKSKKQDEQSRKESLVDKYYKG